MEDWVDEQKDLMEWERKGGLKRDYGKGRLKLTSIWGVVLKPNIVKASYNITIYEGDLNKIAK